MNERMRKPEQPDQRVAALDYLESIMDDEFRGPDLKKKEWIKEQAAFKLLRESIEAPPENTSDAPTLADGLAALEKARSNGKPEAKPPDSEPAQADAPESTETA